MPLAAGSTVRAWRQPRDVVVVLLDSLNRHMIGAYGGTRVRHAEPRSAGRRGRCGSPTTTPARSRACPPATTCWWAPSTSRGGPWGSIEVWEDAITTLLRQQAGISTMLASDHPHLFETGRRELPRRLRRLGLPARPRGRPVAHPARPVLDRRAGAARPPAAVGARLRHQPHVVQGRGRLPRARRRWRRPPPGSTASCRPNARAARARPAGGRRVRPARALRHPGAVGQPLRPRLGRRAAHLAAVRAEPGAVRAHRPRERPPAQPVRRQALDDRPLARPHPRRRRPPRRVGHHRVHPLHRPRPLPRRARASGASRRSPCTPSSATSRCSSRGRASRPARAARSPPPSTSTPRCATPSACSPSTAPTAARSCRCSRAPPRRCASGRCAGCGVARCTSPTPPAPSPRRRSSANRPLSMFSNRWSTMPIRALPGYRMPRPDDRAWLDRSPGSDVPVIRQPFDPSDDLPFWGMGALRRRRALRPRGGRRRRVPQPGRRRRRQGDDRPPRRGAPLDRGARRAARPAGRSS